MKAQIKSDNTVRTIEIDISDGPALDVTQSWHSRPISIRVDHVRIVIRGNVIKSLDATGGLLKKDGTASATVRTGKTWHGADYWRHDERIAVAPEWAQQLWYTVENNLTTLHLTDSFSDLVDGIWESA